MRGRVPGTGFPHVLGVCREYHVCTSVTGTVLELRSHPGSGAPAGRAPGVLPGGPAGSGVRASPLGIGCRGGLVSSLSSFKAGGIVPTGTNTES